MKNNKQQTAVEWLISTVNKQSWGDFRIDIPNEIIQQAKEMEKQRMIEFAELCWKNLLRSDVIMRPRDVYNETYGGDDE
jgi:hypothetical protein